MTASHIENRMGGELHDAPPRSGLAMLASDTHFGTRPDRIEKRRDSGLHIQEIVPVPASKKGGSEFTEPRLDKPLVCRLCG